MPVFDWAILAVAAASLVFAGIAYRAVMRTTRRVDGVIEQLPPNFKEQLQRAANQLSEAVDVVKSASRTIVSPQFAGDAIHHAVMKDEGAMMEEMGQHLNGIVHEAMPQFTKLAAKEAMAALSVMTTPGQARALKEKSGAAQGYLNLGGSIQRQAVKTGAEGMMGGALGGILSDPTWGPIAQSFIQDALAKRMGGGNGGAPLPQHNQPKEVEWRPPL